MNNYTELKKSKILVATNSEFSENIFSSVYSLEGEEKTVYGKILKGEEGEIDQISIMSEEMLVMDNKYFDNKTTNYHPYFCEFSLDNYEKLDETTKKILKSSVGKWLKMCLVGDKFSNGDAYTLHGELIFSASPIIRVGCCLTFDFNNYKESLSEKSFYKKMNKSQLLNVINGYLETEAKVIEEKFKSITNELVSLQGFVYNVGQGNCISIDLRNIKGIKRIFFDIGNSMHPKDAAEERFYIEENNKRIIEETPSIIILSHWDVDHILGAYALSEKVFTNTGKQGEKTYWVTPDLRMLLRDKRSDDLRMLSTNNCSASAARLCAYLVKTKTILMFRNNTNGNADETNVPAIVLESDDEKIKLCQGAGIDTSNGIRNNIGLILSIEFDTYDNNAKPLKQRLLFAGDCEYAQMHPEILHKTYDFLVTSHHGSKYAVLNRSMDMNCCVSSQGHARAIISTGVNKYHHPEAEHINALVANGFEVHFTIGYQRIGFKVSNKHLLEIQHYPNKKQREKIDIKQLSKQAKNPEQYTRS